MEFPGLGLPGLAAARVLPQLLQQAGIGLAALDGHGRLSMLSPMLQAVVGRPFSPVPSAALPDLFHLYSAHGLRKLSAEEVPLARARAGEAVTDALVAVKVPGRPVRHLRSNAVPLPAADGSHRGALAIVEEVTHAHAGSATYAQMRERLVARMNHELRTPLAALLGHAELLADQDVDLSAAAAGSLRALQRAVHRLASLAGEIASITEEDSGAPAAPGSPARDERAR